MSNTFHAKTNSDAGVRLPLAIETVGGLPIAVIDRMESARLMLDVALARRNSKEPAVVFTSANGLGCVKTPALAAGVETSRRIAHHES